MHYDRSHIIALNHPTGAAQPDPSSVPIPRLAISLVLYKNSTTDVQALRRSVDRVTVPFDLFVYDNSPTDKLRSFFVGPENFRYRHDPANVGFGRGHNHNLRGSFDHYDYHLVINPDISFGAGVIEQLVRYMEEHPGVAHVMPQVVLPNGKTQALVRRIPRPLRLLKRRLFNHSQPPVVEKPKRAEFLSGCFMLIRSEALRRAGLFDERFFLYFEDLDLSQRLSAEGTCMYLPNVKVVHNYAGGSRRSLQLTWLHLQSFVKYYNKHGWRPLW